MAKGKNKVNLIGNLGKDPEVRTLGSGEAVANVTLATGESWNDKTTGEKKERTEWHNVVFYGGLADIVSKFCTKGSRIDVEGSLRTRKWEKDGIERYTTEIVAKEIILLDGAQGSTSQGSSAPQQRPQQNSQQQRPQGNGYQNSQQQRPQGNAQQNSNQRPTGNAPQQRSAPQQSRQPAPAHSDDGGYGDDDGGFPDIPFN